MQPFVVPPACSPRPPLIRLNKAVLPPHRHFSDAPFSTPDLLCSYNSTGMDASSQLQLRHAKVAKAGFLFTKSRALSLSTHSSDEALHVERVQLYCQPHGQKILDEADGTTANLVYLLILQRQIHPLSRLFPLSKKRWRYKHAKVQKRKRRYSCQPADFAADSALREADERAVALDAAVAVLSEPEQILVNTEELVKTGNSRHAIGLTRHRPRLATAARLHLHPLAARLLRRTPAASDIETIATFVRADRQKKGLSPHPICTQHLRQFISSLLSVIFSSGSGRNQGGRDTELPFNIVNSTLSLDALIFDVESLGCTNAKLAIPLSDTVLAVAMCDCGDILCVRTLFSDWASWHRRLWSTTRTTFAINCTKHHVFLMDLRGNLNPNPRLVIDSSNISCDKATTLPDSEHQIITHHSVSTDDSNSEFTSLDGASRTRTLQEADSIAFIQVSNCQFSDQTFSGSGVVFSKWNAGKKGGCISTHYSDHTFHRCIFRKNTAAERGGTHNFNQPDLIFFEDSHFDENTTLEYWDNAKDFAFNLCRPEAIDQQRPHRNENRLDCPPLIVERPKQRAQNPSQRHQNLISEQHRVMIETKRGTSGKAADAASGGCDDGEERAEQRRIFNLDSSFSSRSNFIPTNHIFCAVACGDNLRSGQVQQRENRKVAYLLFRCHICQHTSIDGDNRRTDNSKGRAVPRIAGSKVFGEFCESESTLIAVVDTSTLRLSGNARPSAPTNPSPLRPVSTHGDRRKCRIFGPIWRGSCSGANVGTRFARGWDERRQRQMKQLHQSVQLHQRQMNKPAECLEKHPKLNPNNRSSSFRKNNIRLEQPVTIQSTSSAAACGASEVSEEGRHQLIRQQNELRADRVGVQQFRQLRLFVSVQRQHKVKQLQRTHRTQAFLHNPLLHQLRKRLRNMKRRVLLDRRSETAQCRLQFRPEQQKVHLQQPVACRWLSECRAGNTSDGMFGEKKASNEWKNDSIDRKEDRNGRTSSSNSDTTFGGGEGTADQTTTAEAIQSSQIPVFLCHPPTDRGERPEQRPMQFQETRRGDSFSIIAPATCVLPKTTARAL
ncbi:hypothetical protein BLNAU_23860 [Blattamonas nauphoetae]|uniref:Right handed beta helix domain-containing protein n=1 Tax=Blattamonas nauphoetae TaxID=2049346 RepID=A0ABQ9WP00_9EUKA|nr:hypothetical protein BLNAU_23860 [Blattamonas nauphoetae]